jgi:hypothetical protein
MNANKLKNKNTSIDLNKLTKALKNKNTLIDLNKSKENIIKCTMTKCRPNTSNLSTMKQKLGNCQKKKCKKETTELKNKILKYIK